jgi:ketosteroid isomerase-like protein
MIDKNAVAGFFDLVNSRDLHAMQDMLTERTEFYFPKTQPLIGKERIIRFFKILFRQYPELVFQVQRIIIQEHAAAVHWINRGTSRKGEPYENEGVTLLEMEGGRLTFISDFFKDTGIF